MTSSIMQSEAPTERLFCEIVRTPQVFADPNWESGARQRFGHRQRSRLHKSVLQPRLTPPLQGTLISVPLHKRCRSRCSERYSQQGSRRGKPSAQSIVRSTHGRREHIPSLARLTIDPDKFRYQELSPDAIFLGLRRCRFQFRWMCCF